MKPPSTTALSISTANNNIDSGGYDDDDGAEMVIFNHVDNYSNNTNNNNNNNNRISIMNVSGLSSSSTIVSSSNRSASNSGINGRIVEFSSHHDDSTTTEEDDSDTINRHHHSRSLINVNSIINNITTTPTTTTIITSSSSSSNPIGFSSSFTSTGKRKTSTSGIKFPDWDPDVKEKKVKKFVNACSDGNFVQAMKLFREGVDINAKDRYDEAALYNAANEGHYYIVKFLVKNGANIDEPNSGSLKQTALWIASYNGKFRVVRRLLKMGANKKVRCSPLIDNTLPEDISIEQGFQHIAEYIREFDYPSYIRIKNNKRRFKTNLVNQQKQKYNKSFVDISIVCPFMEGNYEDYYIENDNQSSSNASSAPKKRATQSNTNLALEPFSSVLYIRDQPFYIYQCDSCESSFFTTIPDFDHQLLHDIDAFNKKSFVPPTQHPTRPFESITNILFNEEFLLVDEDTLPPIECPDFDVGNGKWFFRSCVAPYEEIESLKEISQFFQPCSILPIPTQYCGEISELLKRYHEEDSSAIYYGSSMSSGGSGDITSQQPRKKVKYSD